MTKTTAINSADPTVSKTVTAHYRKEEAKAYRRKHGDRGGCRYQDKLHRMGDNPWSNTISTVTKDNLLCTEYL